MNATNLIAWMSFAFALTVTTVGCGNQGFRTTGESLSSNGQGSAPDVTSALAKAKSATEQAEQAIADAQAAIAEISDANGNISIGLFAASTANHKGTGLLAPITGRLEAVFTNLFAKIDLVKAQVASARLALAGATSQLDPKQPAQALLIQQIALQMAQIDLLEKTFQASMRTLAGKLDQATGGLDKLVTLGTSFIPVPGLGVVAGIFIDMFLLGDVKSLIAGAKLKLLSV